MTMMVLSRYLKVTDDQKVLSSFIQPLAIALANEEVRNATKCLSGKCGPYQPYSSDI